MGVHVCTFMALDDMQSEQGGEGGYCESPTSVLVVWEIDGKLCSEDPGPKSLTSLPRMASVDFSIIVPIQNRPVHSSTRFALRAIFSAVQRIHQLASLSRFGQLAASRSSPSQPASLS